MEHSVVGLKVPASSLSTTRWSGVAEERMIAAISARPHPTEIRRRVGTITVREQETLLRALDLLREALGAMGWEARAEAALALLIVRDDELEDLRRRIQRGKLQ